MARKPKPTARPVDVDAVRAAYVAQTDSVAKIARKFRTTTSAIYHMRARFGWPNRRPPVKAPAAGTSGPQRPKPRRGTLGTRMLKLTKRTLKRLEESMGSDAPPTIADTERINRALGAMLRNVAKVAELDRNARHGDVSGADAATVDAEQLRRALAERLERAVARRSDAAGDPE